jgi:hypothetical protein
LLVLKTVRDIELELTASQLSQIVTGAETMILNEVRLAPCSHAGSRWQKEGESQQRCGVCSREIEDDWRESLASA